MLAWSRDWSHGMVAGINTPYILISEEILPTVNYFTSPRRNSPTHSSHLNVQKISSLFFHQQARKSSAPEHIQRLFRLQNWLSRKSPISRKYSKTFRAAAINSSDQQQQPTAATSSSNKQQQLPAATTSSNQQQQSGAATSSSDQQQQTATAINISNQQQQPAFVRPAAPIRSTPTSVSYHYGS